CLEKDCERRWQNVADVTGELRWIADHPIAPSVAGAPPAPSSRLRRVAITLALVVAAAAVAIAIRSLRGAGATSDPFPVRFEIATAPTDDPSMALSPDGTNI